jgi:hypothetical protein
MASTLLRPSPLDLEQSFSFYVPGRDPQRIRDCAQQADAVVINGAAGPTSVLQLRRQGWEGIVFFDRAAYGPRPGRVDPSEWFDQQEEAGADRLLTPGSWIEAGKGHASFDLQINAEATLAQRRHATCVLCIDHRWLTKSPELVEMRSVLEGLDVQVALVLADSGDPLGHPGAVDGLTMLTRRVPKLCILRCDHGAIGALAFHAAHGSIGLQATYRHAVPPERTASAIPNDRSARVFVRDLMDWFTAATIASWSTTQVSKSCSCACCEGREIVRFFDPRHEAEADLHNRLVLSNLAMDILQIPDDTEQRHAFSQLCRDAIENYGPMGTWLTEIKPKAQLEQWAQYA